MSPHIVVEVPSFHNPEERTREDLRAFVVDSLNQEDVLAARDTLGLSDHSCRVLTNEAHFNDSQVRRALWELNCIYTGNAAVDALAFLACNPNHPEVVGTSAREVSLLRQAAKRQLEDYGMIVAIGYQLVHLARISQELATA